MIRSEERGFARKTGKRRESDREKRREKEERRVRQMRVARKAGSVGEHRVWVTSRRIRSPGRVTLLRFYLSTWTGHRCRRDASHCYLLGREIEKDTGSGRRHPRHIPALRQRLYNRLARLDLPQRHERLSRLLQRPRNRTRCLRLALRPNHRGLPFLLRLCCPQSLSASRLTHSPFQQ